MERQEAIPNLAYAAIGAVLEDPIPIVVRGVLWIFVAVWFPIWLTILLLIGIFSRPLLKNSGVELGEILGWGIDIVLYLLTWRAMSQLFGNWLVASALLGAVLVYMGRSGTLFMRRGSGAKLVIFREPDAVVQAAVFVQQTLKFALAVLGQHGWTQDKVRQNNIELKRFKYKAQLAPKGQLEIVCFDESFEGDATYPMPLLGEVTLTLDLPGESTVSIRAIYDEISKAVHEEIPETRGTIM